MTYNVNKNLETSTSEEDGLKSIEYQNLVGLLKAIKDQQNKLMN